MQNHDDDLVAFQVKDQRLGAFTACRDCYEEITHLQGGITPGAHIITRAEAEGYCDLCAQPLWLVHLYTVGAEL
jgi:hypothetical protein